MQRGLRIEIMVRLRYVGINRSISSKNKIKSAQFRTGDTLLCLAETISGPSNIAH
jgi:hypothetical protein